MTIGAAPSRRAITSRDWSRRVTPTYAIDQNRAVPRDAHARRFRLDGAKVACGLADAWRSGASSRSRRSPAATAEGATRTGSGGAGGAAGHRQCDGRNQGHGWRLRFRRIEIQSRDAGHAADGKLVQGVRLRDGARAGRYAIRHGDRRARVTFRSGGQNYSPHNYDEKFEGRITLRRALADSRNMPAVRLLDKVGIENVIDTGAKIRHHEPAAAVSAAGAGRGGPDADGAHLRVHCVSGRRHSHRAALHSPSDFL